MKYDDKGLIPAVIQEFNSGEILMMGYMNSESLTQTFETGEAWFWSRSRQELWHKGGTSGNVLKVKKILKDCDEDCLLVLAVPAGPSCHTGERSSFYRNLEGKKDVGFLKNPTVDF